MYPECSTEQADRKYEAKWEDMKDSIRSSEIGVLEGKKKKPRVKMILRAKYYSLKNSNSDDFKVIALSKS